MTIDRSITTFFREAGKKLENANYIINCSQHKTFAMCVHNYFPANYYQSRIISPHVSL
jgi:hypothetical protein